MGPRNSRWNGPGATKISGNHIQTSHASAAGHYSGNSSKRQATSGYASSCRGRSAARTQLDAREEEGRIGQEEEQEISVGPTSDLLGAQIDGSGCLMCGCSLVCRSAQAVIGVYSACLFRTNQGEAITGRDAFSRREVIVGDVRVRHSLHLTRHVFECSTILNPILNVLRRRPL